MNVRTAWVALLSLSRKTAHKPAVPRTERGSPSRNGLAVQALQTLFTGVPAGKLLRVMTDTAELTVEGSKSW